MAFDFTAVLPDGLMNCKAKKGRMMTAWTKLLAAALMASAWLGVARAAEFEVGRATVVFATDGWRASDLPDTGRGYGGDRTGVIASESKLFVKTAATGGVEAVVMVRGSKGGVPAVYMTYTRTCHSNGKFYAEGNTGDALRMAHCLRVHPAYTTQSLLDDLGEPGKSILQAHKGNLPQAMQVVTSSYANSNGTFVEVYVWLAPGFEGSPGTLGEALPEGVKASHVTWGRALNNAVRSSVNSIFGTLKIPALSFDLTPPGSNGNLVTQGPQSGN